MFERPVFGSGVPKKTFQGDKRVFQRDKITKQPFQGRSTGRSKRRSGQNKKTGRSGQNKKRGKSGQKNKHVRGQKKNGAFGIKLKNGASRDVQGVIRDVQTAFRDVQGRSGVCRVFGVQDVC